MPRKMGVLVFAFLLLLASFAARWYNTAGLSSRLDASDARVAAALDYLSTQNASAGIARSGAFLQAWLSKADPGYQVYVALDSGDNPWLAWVNFDGNSVPVSSGFRLWTGMLVPGYLRNLSIAFFALWILAAFVAPHIFGVKCPDCPQNLIAPPLTDVQEFNVYGGGFDKDGYDLQAIVRRDYVCQRCGYRRITYYVPGLHSGWLFAGPIKRWTGTGMLLNIKESEWYDRVLGKYLADLESGSGSKFRTHDEWKAFYDELKASEREERRAG